MCSAHEVTLVNAMHGADGGTGATTGALLVIDGCKVVYHGNCTVGAGLFALLTADTAVGAILSYRRTAVVVRALDNNAGGIVDKVDDVVGAGTCANTAANTLTGVNLCHAVDNADGIFGTYGGTVTVAKAGIGAEAVTAVSEVSVLAGLDAHVLVLLLYDVAGAVAGNVCNLFYNVLRLNAEDPCDILCRGVTARGTKVCSGFGSICESLRISVTAGVATSAAVCTGEAVTDSNEFLILFNSEEDVGNGKKNGTNNSDARKEQNSK